MAIESNGNQMGRRIDVNGGKMRNARREAPIQGEDCPVTPGSASGLDTQESGPRSAGRMKGRQRGNQQRDPVKDTHHRPAAKNASDY